MNADIWMSFKSISTYEKNNSMRAILSSAPSNCEFCINCRKDSYTLGSKNAKSWNLILRPRIYLSTWRCRYNGKSSFCNRQRPINLLERKGERERGKINEFIIIIILAGFLPTWLNGDLGSQVSSKGAYLFSSLSIRIQRNSKDSREFKGFKGSLKVGHTILKTQFTFQYYGKHLYVPLFHNLVWECRNLFSRVYRIMVHCPQCYRVPASQLDSISSMNFLLRHHHHYSHPFSV